MTKSGDANETQHKTIPKTKKKPPPPKKKKVFTALKFGMTVALMGAQCEGEETATKP